MRQILVLVFAVMGVALTAGYAGAAAPGVTTANVNLRAGPGTAYPVVVTVPKGSPITTYGCQGNYSWCDVSWGGERGWMSASYIYVTYQGRRRVLTPALAPAVGITVVVFNRNYWNRYYSGRPWYRNWNRYYRQPGIVQPVPRRRFRTR
jgi:uncharacterized protein YraI